MSLLTKFNLDNLSRPTQLIALAVVLVLFIALSFLSRKWSDRQLINEINFSGLYFLTPSELNKYINKDVLNKQKKDVSLPAIHKKLVSNPYIYDVDLSVTITGTLKVDVTERTPVSYIIKSGGELAFVDTQGVFLPFRYNKKNENLPVLTGINFTNKYDTNAVKNGTRIIDYLKTNDDANIFQNISELHFDSRYNSFDLILNDFSTQIKIGRTDNMNDKLKKLTKLLNNSDGIQVLQNSKYIDLRWLGQIISGSI